MTWFVTVVVDGGYQKVLKNISDLCSKVRRSAPLNEKVLIAFDPSIQSQLDNRNVGGWTKVCNQLYASLGNKYNLTVQFLQPQQVSEKIDLNVSMESGSDIIVESQSTDKIYNHVCMGGTFDRLHTGHKILLSTALLRSKNSLTVGVAGSQLLGKKTLPELIEPLDVRIKGVEHFLKEVNRDIEMKICEIQDPFGPSIVDGQLQCIVGSQETEKGCHAVNEKRRERDLSILDVHCIPLVQDDQKQADYEEDKISSSSMRTRLLGHRLRGAYKQWDKSKGAYIIGLTGGSASGKSSVGRRLEKLGAGLVDCDKLGHAAYLPGSPTLDKIVQQFGPSVLSDDGTINRKALGAIVFSEKSKLETLNQIVWPEISRMAHQQADKLFASGHNVVVLDAAVLIEAGWNKDCHEVWVCTVPRATAIQRIIERDNKSEEEAENRLNSQMSNLDRCEVANTVFCTVWDGEVTQGQVLTAWNTLMNELKLQS